MFEETFEMTVDTQEVEEAIGSIASRAESPHNVFEFGTDTLVVRDGVVESQPFSVKATPME